MSLLGCQEVGHSSPFIVTLHYMTKQTVFDYCVLFFFFSNEGCIELHCDMLKRSVKMSYG